MVGFVFFKTELVGIVAGVFVPRKRPRDSAYSGDLEQSACYLHIAKLVDHSLA